MGVAGRWRRSRIPPGHVRLLTPPRFGNARNHPPTLPTPSRTALSPQQEARLDPRNRFSSKKEKTFCVYFTFNYVPPPFFHEHELTTKRKNRRLPSRGSITRGGEGEVFPRFASGARVIAQRRRVTFGPRGFRWSFDNAIQEWQKVSRVYTGSKIKRRDIRFPSV